MSYEYIREHIQERTDRAISYFRGDQIKFQPVRLSWCRCGSFPGLNVSEDMATLLATSICVRCIIRHTTPCSNIRVLFENLLRE